jgi:hypothetical protein
MRGLKISALVFLFPLLFYVKGLAQNTDQENYDALKTVINNKEFRFMAQSANTMKGSTLPVDPGYELKLMTDSLKVDFPYFENGYSANFGTNDDVVKYNSRNFTYSAEMTKKGGWNINIIPKDNTDIKKMSMNISNAGYCTLRINFSHRDPISFYGTIGDNLSH